VEILKVTATGARSVDLPGAKRRRHDHPDSSYYQTLTETVAQIQKSTCATIAVVVHAQSGSYRDVDYLCGAGLAWLVLCFLVFIPAEVHDWNLPIYTGLLFLVGEWVCSRTRLRRWLTSRKRRRRQVKRAAEAAFVEEGVYHAPEGRGLLIYWSRFERSIEVVADTGILTILSAEPWHRLLFHLRRVPFHEQPSHHFLEQLHHVGKMLAKHLPAPPEQSDLLPKPGGSS
jgi:putative membrane protein